MGLVVKAKIIGILNFERRRCEGPQSDMLPDDDRHTDDSIRTLSDMGERWQQQITHHFTHYKHLKKPGTTKVLGYEILKRRSTFNP